MLELLKGRRIEDKSNWYNVIQLASRDDYELVDKYTGTKRTLGVLLPEFQEYRCATRFKTSEEEEFHLVEVVGYASIGGKVQRVVFSVRPNSHSRSKTTGYILELTVPSGKNYRFYTVKRALKYDEHPSSLVSYNFSLATGLPVVDECNNSYTEES